VPVTTQLAANVYPILQSFTTTIPTPNISWTAQDPMSGIKGIQAAQANATGLTKAGITFNANVLTGGLSIQYLQNGLSVQNGANGTTSGGKAVGATFLGGIAAKNVTINANSGFTFPGLDADNGQTYYVSTLSNNPDGSVTVSAMDSPASGGPGTDNVNKSLDTIDVKFSFKMYLVMVFSDGSMYAFANDTWNVNFYATTNLETDDWPGGPSVIKAASGVTAQGTSYINNDDPQKTSGPVMNASIGWTSA
jgi:hypothetical protein